MKVNEIFSEFVNSLSRDVSTEVLYNQLANWLSQHSEFFSPDNSYFKAALKLANLNSDDFYLNHEVVPAVEIQQLIMFPPSNAASLAMRLRDILWTIICKKIEYWGSNGDIRDGCLLFNPESGLVVIEDDHGMLLNGDLKPIKSNPLTQLQPATRHQVDLFFSNPFNSPNLRST